MDTKKIQWILRIGIFGEFLGHGIFGIQGKQAWIGWTEALTGLDTVAAGKLVLVVGIIDVLIALSVLIKPMRPVLLWAAIWGLWTAIMRPLVGEPIWDFVERFPNWAAPLALFYLLKEKSNQTGFQNP